MTWPGTSPSGRFLTLNIGGGLGSIDWEEAAGDVSGVIDSLVVIGLRGRSISDATPVFGDVLFFDGSQWVPAASGTPAASGAPHNLLSVTHPDTVPASPSNADLIAGSGNPASWAKFPAGAPGQSLTISQSGDLEWSGLGIAKTEVISSGAVINLDAESRRVILKTGTSETVNLPNSPLVGQEIIIKDGDGDAGPPVKNTIDIIPQSGALIDGLSTVQIRSDYGAFTLLWDGTDWNIT